MKNLKAYKDFVNEAKSKFQASDFKVGDKFIFKWTDPNSKGFGKEQIVRGEVLDHFGEGIFVEFNKAIKWFDEEYDRRHRDNYNYLNTSGASKRETRFEIYNDEHDGPSSFNNITKIL